MNRPWFAPGMICVAIAVIGLLPTGAAGQKPAADTPAPASPDAGRKTTRLNCAGEQYAAAYCDQLQQFMDAGPSDALKSDGTLNTDDTAVDGSIAILRRPYTSGSLLVQTLAPTAALGNEAKAYANAIEAWNAARMDQQFGLTQSSTASTDVVAKPGASGLLSLASESGAFASTVNSSSLTLSGNPWNAFHLMTTGSLYGSGICSSQCVNPLRTMNIVAAFTVDQSGSTTAPTSGPATGTTQDLTSVILPTSNTRLSAITSRWNFWHSLDPGSARFQTAWRQAVKAQHDALKAAGQDLGATTADLIRGLGADDLNDTVFQGLYAEIDRELAADYKTQNGKQLVRDYENFLERFVARCKQNDPNNFNAAVFAAAGALTTFEQLNQSIIDSARGTPILTAEYTFSRPTNQPSTNDIRLVVAESWSTGAQLSANLATSIYYTVPAGAAYGRVKDVQLSAEYDQAIGNKSSPTLVISVAGYGQYQWDPSVLNVTSANLAPGTDITLPNNAQQFLGTAGWLGIVQAKATIQLQKSITIPLAVKWSNKTDLLNSQDVRGQFGISYDFSSLVSSLKGK